MASTSSHKPANKRRRWALVASEGKNRAAFASHQGAALARLANLDPRMVMAVKPSRILTDFVGVELGDG